MFLLFLWEYFSVSMVVVVFSRMKLPNNSNHGFSYKTSPNLWWFRIPFPTTWIWKRCCILRMVPMVNHQHFSPPIWEYLWFFLPFSKHQTDAPNPNSGVVSSRAQAYLYLRWLGNSRSGPGTPGSMPETKVLQVLLGCLMRTCAILHQASYTYLNSPTNAEFNMVL